MAAETTEAATTTRSTTTIHYLLVYSFDDNKLVATDAFTDRRSATKAYEDAEAKYADCFDKFEIVLLGADSLETIMKTHGHYFASSSDSLFSGFLTTATLTA